MDRNHAVHFCPLWCSISFAAGIVDAFRVDAHSFLKAVALVWADWFGFCHEYPSVLAWGGPARSDRLLLIHRRSLF